LLRRSATTVTITIAIASALLFISNSAHAQQADEEEPRRYFYKNLPYGSQTLFNPIYAMLNRGFDVLQLRKDRNIGQVKSLDVKNIGGNLADPFSAIEGTGEGWSTFLTSEVFPLSYGQQTARWVPNYTLHLLGGGVTYAEMREWFLDHDAPLPAATAFSAAALLTGAIVNESLENKGVVGFNTDAIADIYIFDIAGMVLFSFERVRRFFTSTLIMSEWSLQPTLTFPRADLHNVGNYYSLKYPLPFYERLRLFAYGGFSTLGGLSFKIDREYSISGAAGVKVGSFDNIGGPYILQNVIGFQPSGAIFLDRNESLLAFVQVSDVFDYTFTANVYPNSFFVTEPGVGTWTAIGRDGRWIAGLSFTRTLSLGFGMGTR
jgi:hypothetical protein